MKIKALCEESVNVDRTTDTWSVIRNMTKNVNQEEAFFVCDLKDIIEKHQIWTANMPRVEPHYGKSYKLVENYMKVLAKLSSINHYLVQFFLMKTH